MTDTGDSLTRPVPSVPAARTDTEPVAAYPPVTGTGAPAPTTSRRAVPTGTGRWRHWRRTRPFWGGVLVILGGAEILASVRAPLPVILHVGPMGLAAYLVPVLLLLCGILLLANPQQRLFYSILAILMALASWLTSNLGGFFLGMLLSLIGGSLAFAWSRPAHTAAHRAADAGSGQEDDQKPAATSPAG